MNAIRSGKIARLPEDIRQELNARLARHESSTPLLNWLNALPEVQAILAEEFGGRPVTRDNLSDWRHGGHAEWRRDQGAREMMKHVFAEEQAADLPVEKVAAWVAAREVVAARVFAGKAGRKKAAWNQLRECCSDMVALQRADHLRQRLEFEKERWGEMKPEREGL